MSAARCDYATSAVFEEQKAKKKEGEKALDYPCHDALKIRVYSLLLKPNSPFLTPRGGFVSTTGPSVRINATVVMTLAAVRITP